MCCFFRFQYVSIFWMLLPFLLNQKPIQCLTCIVLALFPIYAQTGWQPSLSDAEVEALTEVVVNRSTLQNQSHQSIAADITLGIEVLLVELQELKSRTEDSPRIAEVFVFDYAQAEASVVLLDVETHQFKSSIAINNIHLPLNAREITVAKSLLTNDVEFLDRLVNEYEKQLAKPFANLDQIDMKLSIWNPGATQVSSHECYLTRCALVSLFTKNHYNFSIEPVVNLSTGTIDLTAVQ